jgi:ABC-2 type transport system ATP-binding protein
VILTGHSLSKTYGSLQALKGVDIACAPGKIYGLLGANGAGKTTLFRILLGLIKPDEGQVTINSDRIKPLGGIIEKPAAYEYLSAQQNLRLFSKIQGAASDKATIEDRLVAVGLSTERKDPVRNFSLGMKQRLGIAIALLNDPECLVLDEPFSGLDPIGIASLRSLIQELAIEQGLSVLVSSHIVDELSKVCDELIVLKSGRIVNRGATQVIIATCTESYVLAGPKITETEVWKGYETKMMRQSVQVFVGAEEIAKIISALAKEEVSITSCTPEISMSKLFDQETK